MKKTVDELRASEVLLFWIKLTNGTNLTWDVNTHIKAQVNEKSQGIWTWQADMNDIYLTPY